MKTIQLILMLALLPMFAFAGEAKVVTAKADTSAIAQDTVCPMKGGKDHAKTCKKCKKMKEAKAKAEATPAASTAPAAEAKKAAPQPAAEVWACPMHPEVKSDKPGKCPKCGMALEKAK